MASVLVLAGNGTGERVNLRGYFVKRQFNPAFTKKFGLKRKTVFYQRRKRLVTAVGKNSQKFFLLFFDDLAENYSVLRHSAWFVFWGSACYVRIAHGML
jgi:hypothetical protein